MAKKTPRASTRNRSPRAASDVDASQIKDLPDFVREQILGPTARAKRSKTRTAGVTTLESRRRLRESGVAPDSTRENVFAAAASIAAKANVPETALPDDVRASN